MPRVTVVGSINMDLAVSTDVIPQQGETVLGNHFATYPGGKGANQAVAAARLGADVHMIGAVGNDTFGKELVEGIKMENISTSGITVFSNKPTGTATILLCEDDNRIIVAPGANAAVTPAHIEEQMDQLKNSDIILMQLEIPLETVSYTARLAKMWDIPVLLNPAPFQWLPDELLYNLTLITPNEKEWASMQTKRVLESFKKKFIVTEGARGVRYFTRDKERLIPGYSVMVKDTTGAGDTFNGALAVGIASGRTMEDSLRMANAAAALSVTRKGAQTGMPTMEELNSFMKS